MKRKKQYFVYSIIGLLLLFAFNNCGEFIAEQDLSSSGSYQVICEGQLKAAYQRTYHTFLKNNCNACHSAIHGSNDLNISFNAFSARGEELIDYQATHAHGGNNFTSAMQTEIDKFKPSWTNAKNNYDDCLEQGANDDGVTTNSLKTASKIIPNIQNTLNNNTWITVEWDLENDVEENAKGKFKAMLRVEAKLNQVNGFASGLLIRNPKMKLKTGSQNISVANMMIYIDGKKQIAVTTYSGVSKIINSEVYTDLVKGSGAAYAIYENLSATTQVGFDFNEVRHTTASPEDDVAPIIETPVLVDIPVVPIPDGGVTFVELTSMTSPYRVFNRSCVSCHGANATIIKLTNYETAKANADRIVARMNDVNSPMPPSGLLNQNDRDLVRSWVNTGTPERR